MGRAIRMQRSELVWETRVSYFEESDWESLKSHYKSFEKYEESTDYWYKDKNAIWKVIQNLTYEDVIAEFERDARGEEPTINFTHQRTNAMGESWSWDQSLYDIVVEWMRDDNYEADVCDSSYADDYEEYVELVD